MKKHFLERKPNDWYVTATNDNILDQNKDARKMTREQFIEKYGDPFIWDRHTFVYGEPELSDQSSFSFEEEA
tara:strand:+ start:72 stop:287 length:216 start_codon:yes stop_codon:yes gene_type:complete